MPENTELRDASELVQSLLSPAPSEVFSLWRVLPEGKRVEYKVRVKFLRIEETHLALQASQQYARDRKEVAKDYGDLYKEAQAVELITRALCHVEKRTRPDGTEYYPPIFVDSKHLRTSFTENEIALCLNMYEIVKAKYSCIEDFSDDAVNLWAARLSDALLGPYFLAQLDSSQWPALLMSLGRAVRDLSASLGRPLPNLHDTSESESESSDNGTTGSTSSPAAQHSASEKPVPNERLLTSQEAREMARKIEKKASGEGDGEG